MKMISAEMRDGYGRSVRIYLNPDNINYVCDNYDGETRAVFTDDKIVAITDDAGAIAEQWALCKAEEGEGEMTWYGECETCAQSDKRYCIGCQPLRKTDGTYSRTGWIAKPGITITVTSLAYPTATKCRKEARSEQARKADRGF